MQNKEKIKMLIDIWESEIRDQTEEIRIGWETALLNEIQPIKDEKIDFLEEIVDVLIKNDNTWDPNPGNPAPLFIFKESQFSSFMEYFTREISDSLKEHIREDIEESNEKPKIACMSESDVESFGSIKDLDKIISLKKPCENIVDTIRGLGFELNDNYKFLNTKLLITYYHRVHSPVSGKINKIVHFPKDNEFFGENSLSIVVYDHACLLLVGESKIQDFIFKVKEGDVVDIFQELGNFSWGSQTVLFFDSTVYSCKLDLETGQHLFVGDVLS